MPGPGFPVANKILYKYEQDRAYRLHRQKVRGQGRGKNCTQKATKLLFKKTCSIDSLCLDE